MVKFKKSRVDRAWICLDCGVAVYPTPENINEHIKNCDGINYSKTKIAPINTALGIKQRDEIRDRLLRGAEKEMEEDVFEWCKSKGYQVPKLIIHNLNKLKGEK